MHWVWQQVLYQKYQDMEVLFGLEKGVQARDSGMKTGSLAMLTFLPGGA